MTAAEFTLRPYQAAAVEAIRAAYAAGDRATLAVLATGLGKTVIAAEVARRCADRGRRLLFLAHRAELITQAAGKLEARGLRVGIEKAAERGGDAEAVVASVQTLRGARLESWARDHFALIVVDEAHHATAAGYRAIVDHFDGARVLGLTATPDRLDGAALGDVFQSCAYRYELAAAIRDGWLAPLRARRIEVDAVDLDGIRVRAGDFREGELGAAYSEAAALLAVARPLVELAEGRPTLAFCSGVEHAVRLAETLNELRPGSARSLSGESAADERAAVVDAFRAGEIQYLTNCALFCEGFDAPETACVALARPTKSRALYAQQIGRGTRTAPGKTDCLVLDFAGGSRRHRLATALDVLAGRELPPEVLAEAEALADAEPDLEALELLDRAGERAETRRIADANRARVKYLAEAVDLLGPLEPRRGGWAADPATEKQREALIKAGFKLAPELSKGEAAAMLDAMTERRRQGLCSPKQARLLSRRGIDARALSKAEAGELISELIANEWRTPRAWRRRGFDAEALEQQFGDPGAYFRAHEDGGS
jgi:superfamily II DNA or RNA helicase